MDNTKSEIKFSCGAQIDSTITLADDKRSVLFGRVFDKHKKPIKDAVIKLFIRKCDDSLKPLTHAFSDCDGHFLLGPLCPDLNYAVKVWYNDVKVKNVDIEFQPGECCLRDDKHDDKYDKYDDKCDKCRDKDYE